MTHCGPQGALPVSRTISRQNVALFIACLLLFDCHRESAGGKVGLITEEYIVWPKKTAEPLSEGYPWKSCNRTTEVGCPGLNDYIHHFCVDYGNGGCPRKNRILAEKRVILNLLPGEHTMAFWRSFSMTLWWASGGHTIPQCHLFCNVSELSIRGTHVSETTIMAVRTNVLKRFKSDEEGDGPIICKWSLDCNGKRLPRPAEWSAFAFRGGGNVTFQDITFRSLSSSPEKYGENFISAWDLRRFEMRRCHFPELRQWRGALALFMSEYVEDTGKPHLVEMVVNDSTFGFEVDVESNGSVFASPAIAVMPLEICETTFAWVRAYGKFSAKLHQCAFQLYFAEDVQCRER